MIDFRGISREKAEAYLLQLDKGSLYQIAEAYDTPVSPYEMKDVMRKRILQQIYE